MGIMGFLHASVVKNLPANVGDVGDAGSIPELGRSPGGGNGNLPQYSCQDNPMDREAWWAIVSRVSKEVGTTERLDMHTHTYTTIGIIFSVYRLGSSIGRANHFICQSQD